MPIRPCGSDGPGTKLSRFGALRLAIGVVLFGGAALVALHDWLGIGGSGLDRLRQRTSVRRRRHQRRPRLPAAKPAAPAASAAPGSRSRPRSSAGRASEIYWTAVLANDPSPPYPSPADIGYLAFYPLAAYGVVLLVRARARELDWRLWMDGLIAALGTAALGAALIFEFVADRTSGTPVQVATTLAYPLGDILMLALVVGVVALTRWRPGRTWSLLLVGLAALVVADVAYTLQIDRRQPAGRRLDRTDLPARRRLHRRRGLAAARPTTIQPMARFDGWRELMVPGFFAAVMIGLFAMQYFSHASGLTTVLWAATMIAVIARLAISVRENKRLLEQVRTDHLTGLGNQGRMQVDLAARCRQRRRASRLTAAAARPQRLQALQRHLRAPGRRRDAGPAGRPAAARRSATTATPTGSAATSSRS